MKIWTYFMMGFVVAGAIPSSVVLLLTLPNWSTGALLMLNGASLATVALCLAFDRHTTRLHQRYHGVIHESVTASLAKVPEIVGRILKTMQQAGAIHPDIEVDDVVRSMDIRVVEDSADAEPSAPKGSKLN